MLRGRSFGFSALTFVFLGSAALFFLSFFRESIWREQLLTSVLVFGMSFVFVANPMVRWFLLLRMKRPPDRTVAAGLRVAVVTTFVPALEPIAMIERTLSAMVALRYPHDTWLLDEGDDSHVKELCTRLGVLHFSRKNLPHYQTPSGVFEARSKHGNYNAWLTEVGFERYDFISAFDPDHIPNDGFLEEILGHFDNPQVGYVQAPQAYYNQSASFVAAGAAEETYDYNSTIQMASYGMGYPIVIGCHNNHRVTALREVGGFAAHDADDVLITILYRRAGWLGVYVPRILARGITPVDWRGYLTQQRRWARSVLDLKLKTEGRLSSEAPLYTRLMNYLHGLNYLQPAFMLIGCLWLLVRSLATAEAPLAIEAMSLLWTLILVGAMTACHLYRQQFFLDPRREFGMQWRARLLRIAKSPFLLLAAIDVIAGQRRKYEITPKVKSDSKRMLSMAFTPIAILIAAAWGIGVLRSDGYPPAFHLIGATALALCLALIATDFVSFPAPYDPKMTAGPESSAP